ncbi:CvfD/Ygs/GSP13 family RNA-binding post-transcriptional regulator [Marinilactibacillus psychrotolerans]|uniref:CvfD/Ygs/GSP13 family RNA-binding post-transcriptional regulator n=2 Tax=Marinilactibacillus psychrotolerans TaxID=191770 RepID=A0A5R9C1M7_9LACT|nr:CvfD/Ygs/GSP13 family RNA-binding post-transcriptional regulator [Marinilactibacillus psychrotolerans]TLQ06599.1 S1 RNA-binding domain-containing protein [Marinilactibacillus psychrotolerans]GEQ33189.1 RNA-binding protein [Marinilactibacillus psychrotolerans]SJN45239.1 SSU ribosomal protein S1p [Marinilactibacillus psychrotolerans 42ea]
MDYKIGNRVRGTVTGIQPYGVFVALDEETQGLVHISELKHGFIKEIEEVVKIGDEVDVIVMDIDEYSRKISLSMRGMHRPKYHPFSNKKKNPRYGRRTGIEFESIRKQLPLWINEALREIEKDE